MGAVPGVQAANMRKIRDTTDAFVRQCRAETEFLQTLAKRWRHILLAQRNVRQVICTHGALHFFIGVDALLELLDQAARFVLVNAITERRINQPEQGGKGFVIHQRGDANDHRRAGNPLHNDLLQTARRPAQQFSNLIYDFGSECHAASGMVCERAILRKSPVNGSVKSSQAHCEIRLSHVRQYSAASRFDLHFADLVVDNDYPSPYSRARNQVLTVNCLGSFLGELNGKCGTAQASSTAAPATVYSR